MTSPYLTDERLMIQAAAREFTMNEVLPVANELDPIQGEIPMDLRRKLGALGYFGIRTPEEYGGLGLGVFEYCMIAEELARGWMSVASIIARAGGVMALGGWPLAKRVELTRKAARGEYLAAVSLSEPNVGSDLAAVSCRAVLDGDEWVITGNKYWCTFADGADYIQLLAARRGARRRSALQGPAHLHHRKAARRVAEGMRRLADSEDRLLRLENVRTRVRRLPHSEGEHHHRRRFGRLQEHRVVPQCRARAYRGALDRTRARRVGGRDGVRARARPVRRSDRGFSGDALQDRAHGERDRSRAPADVPRRHRNGPRPARPTRKPRW